MNLYGKTLRALIADGTLDPHASTLVVAGGYNDREALLEAGFTDVTISNLDERLTGEEFQPFGWAFKDAEDLDYPDNSFDQVIEHAGLHHCGSPHRGLLEMYRVARSKVLIFESRDSLLMRTAVRLGIGTDFEVEAVVAHNGEFGGHRNSATPNFVYRWTEREVVKAVTSYDPKRVPSVRFFYHLRLPTLRMASYRSNITRIVAAFFAAPVQLAAKLFPKQSNEFGFLVVKADRHWPWIDPESGGVSHSYVEKKFVGYRSAEASGKASPDASGT